ncbi:MAG: GTP-binding protein [Clostridiales bacterium]|nr:GTP-binding protein [Clostridiales bacterium]
MTKIDIFSGFLGAGKTTLIKKLIAQAYAGEKIVLIENEFGEIGIDGGFLSEAGINITEMNSGCICCSLVGDFTKALSKVIEEYAPERIIIEPSGVGKLSDVVAAVQSVPMKDVVLGARVCVADAKKCVMYAKNFGEFFNNQIENAFAVILSHTGGLAQDKLDKAVAVVKKLNPNAVLVTTDWDQIDGSQIKEAIEGGNELAKTMMEEMKAEHDVCPTCGHHHDEHHEHHEHHECEHDHAHHEHCHAHEHDHEHDHCHEHEHHHDHEHHHHEGCGCHGEHHHHHADEVFESIGGQSARRYTREEIQNALNALENQEAYGMVLRAKGIVESTDGSWIHFDYVPGEPDVRTGGPDTTGKICVIGSGLNKEALKELFRFD